MVCNLVPRVVVVEPRYERKHSLQKELKPCKRKHCRQSVAPIGLGSESREWKHRLPPPPLTVESARQDAGPNGPPRKAARYEEVTTVPDDVDIHVQPLIYTGRQGWPQVRIDHGKSGDALLNEFFKKHNTFSGARVYIQASKGFSSPSASSSDPPASSSKLEGGRRQQTDLPIAKKQGGARWNQ